MVDLILIRGDRRTLLIDDLVDVNDNPAVFGPGDVLIWTMKANLAADGAEALITKTSVDGGITISGATATVNLVASDWTGIALTRNVPFVWDLQLAIGGSSDQIVTLANGDGEIWADVTGNPITDPVPTGGLSGPCQAWATVDDALRDPRAVRSDGTPLNPGLLAEKLDVASEILYRLTGRIFSGVCTDVVRPTRRWYRSDYQPPWQWQWLRGWGNYTSRPPHRADGTRPLQEITLGQYPVRQIIEVISDGVVLDPSTYRLDDMRWLVNISPTINWTIVPDMTATSGVGFFQVTFEYGTAAPRGGVAACKRFGIELARGASGDTCLIPERVMTINTQGMSYALLDPMTFIDDGKTGIYEVDTWIKSVNPSGLRRRSSVLSPDFPRPVRRAGTTPGS